MSEYGMDLLLLIPIIHLLGGEQQKSVSEKNRVDR
jgi:hypothetical protein